MDNIIDKYRTPLDNQNQSFSISDEKTIEAILEENQRLHDVLAEFISAARDNRQSYKLFRSYELQLLSCHQLDALINMLLEGLKEQFHLDACSLWLHDADRSLHELFTSLRLTFDERSLKLINQYQVFTSIYQNCSLQLKKTLSEQEQDRFFPDQLVAGSAALLPLIRNGIIIGSLHLGSKNSERFSPLMATDFLENLAYIVSLCIENSIKQQQLLRLSMIDMLTHTYNRRAFNKHLSQELSRTERLKQPLSLLFVDIDYFKMVNDTYGHHVGDIALREVARTVNEQLRSVDFLARFGGEEFIILLPNTEHQSALLTAERIRQSVKITPIIHGEDVLRVTCSIGLSTWKKFGEYRKHPEESETLLLSTADEALYLSKQHGRDQVRYLPLS